MRTEKAMLVFRKDWREVSRNWQVILPMIIVPLMFSIVLPLLVIVLPSMATAPEASSGDFGAMINSLPVHVRNEIAGMTDRQAMIYIMSLYFFAPFFLIIPLMASSVIASDSFAGEKERKTIEALLATPISDGELFLGKTLVSFVPSMMVTVVSFLIYLTVVNMASFNVFDGRLLLPNLVWIMLVVGLAPTLALVSIGLTVMISARVKGFREAQQINGLLMIPILGLVFAQISGAAILGPAMVVALIGIFAGLDIVVFSIGMRTFKREEILPKRT